MKPSRDTIHLTIDKHVQRQVVDYCVLSEDNFEELMQLFFDEDLRVCHYSSNPILAVLKRKPNWLYPYFSKMMDGLYVAKHDSYIRNTLRIWQFHEIPEEQKGEVYEVCFNYLNDPKQAVAIRVFSMTILGNIAEHYPELILELIELIKLYYPQGSAGYKSRAKKVLAKLNAL